MNEVKTCDNCANNETPRQVNTCETCFPRPLNWAPEEKAPRAPGCKDCKHDRPDPIPADHPCNHCCPSINCRFEPKAPEPKPEPKMCPMRKQRRTEQGDPGIMLEFEEFEPCIDERCGWWNETLECCGQRIALIDDSSRD